MIMILRAGQQTGRDGLRERWLDHTTRTVKL